MSSLATILKELLLQGAEQAKRHHSFRLCSQVLLSQVLGRPVQLPDSTKDHAWESLALGF
jgi:hypothetical protein